MSETDISNNSDSHNNTKFLGIIGLVIGIVGGAISILYDGNLQGLGIMIGTTFTGITSVFFIYFILLKKEIPRNENMLLAGVVSGFFFSSFILILIQFFL